MTLDAAGAVLQAIGLPCFLCALIVEMTGIRRHRTTHSAGPYEWPVSVTHTSYRRPTKVTVWLSIGIILNLTGTLLRIVC